jgi:hypothetical protein
MYQLYYPESVGFCFLCSEYIIDAVSVITDDGEMFTLENSAPFKRKTVHNTSGRCQSFI